MKTKYFFANVKSVNEADRTIDIVASTGDKDRDGEIVLPSAFMDSIDSFKSNPVILACHQHRLESGSSPVIGSGIPETIYANANEVGLKIQFANTKLGDEYWQLYKDKHMRAFSIGFIPEKWQDEKDDQSSYGSIRTFTQIELLEISAVPVPSNRRALARAKGYFEDDDSESKGYEKLQSFIDEQLKKFDAKFDEFKDEIKSILIADSDDLAERFLSGEPDGADHTAGDKNKSGISDVLNRLETAINTAKE